MTLRTNLLQAHMDPFHNGCRAYGQLGKRAKMVKSQSDTTVMLVSPLRGEMSLHQDLTFKHGIDLMKIPPNLFPSDTQSVLQ